MRRFNQKNRKKRTIYTYFIILILCMSLGYAFLTSDVKFNGFSKMFNSSWSIHFDNVVEASGNVELSQNDIAANINPNDNTEVDYSITLKAPGDYYEFSVDAVNDGTVDAMVNLIASKIKVGNGQYVDIDDDLPGFIDYSLKYADGAPVMVNHSLKAGQTETYVVRVGYRKDVENISDLPAEDTQISFKLDPEYTQINSDAVDRVPYVNCTYEGDLVQGAEYVNGQFTYRYMQEMTLNGWSNLDYDGWGVVLTDKTSTDPVNTTLCTMINKKPVVSMSDMFADSQATSYDLSSFITDNVLDMSGMFRGSKVVEADISNFDLTNTNFAQMFALTENLQKVTIDNLNLNNLNFNSRLGIPAKNIDTGEWEYLDIDDRTIWQYLFYQSNVKELSLKNWTIGDKFDISIGDYMSASNIEKLDVSGWNLDNTHNISTLFSGLKKIEQITGLDTWDTSNIENMYNLFYGCNHLLSIELDNWNTESVTNMSGMFCSCNSLSELDFSNWNTSNVVNMSMMFINCSSLDEINLSSFDTSNVTDIHLMFVGCTGLTEIDLSNFNTGNVVNMENMFTSCTGLKTIDLSNFDTSNVTNMNFMFNGCTNLEEINLSNFKMGTVTLFHNLFSGTPNLHTLILDNWDLSGFSLDNGSGVLSNINLTNLSCRNWKLPVSISNWIRYWSGYYIDNIDVTGWDFSNTTSSYGIFAGCNKTKEIVGLDTWDTSNFTDMSDMFYNCYVLDELNLINWDTRNVTNMVNMFEYCNSLKKIYVSDLFITDAVTNDSYMFYNDTQLVGGMGTTYVNNKVGKEYARIDEGTSNPGYFTYATAVITFNTNGGNVDEIKKYVVLGRAIGDLPFPEKNDYAFAGWYTSLSDGIEIDKNTVVTENTTYYARWVDPIIITFDANGGDLSYSEKRYAAGRKLGYLPVPVKDDSVFGGWYTALSNGIKVSEDTVVNESTTFYAKWIDMISIDDLSWEEIVNSAQNGDLSLFKIGSEKEVDLGEYGVHRLRVANTSTPNECSQENFSQTACGLVLEFSDIILSDVMDDSNIYQWAGSWEPTHLRQFINNDIYNLLPTALKNGIIETNVISGHNGNDSDNIVTTDKLYLLNNKEVWGDKIKDYSNYDTSFDNSRQLDYYYMNGVTIYDNPYSSKNNWWWLRSIASYSSNEFTVVSPGGGQHGNDHPIYNSNGVSPAFRIRTVNPDNSYKIIFDNNDEFGLLKNVYVEKGSPIGYLPTLTWDDFHSFAGWYTSIDGGERVDENYIPNSDLSLYARWDVTPYYQVNYNTNGGSLDSNFKRIGINSSIGELPIPEYDGYYLDGWYTSPENGLKIDETYIPNNNVTIYARWKKSVRSLNVSNTSITITNPGAGAEFSVSGEIDENYTISSSNSNIVTVDQAGHITDVADGEAVINITGLISGQVKEVDVLVNYNKYVISFNSCGGSNVDNVKVYYGNSIGDLPIPTKDTFYFEGWYLDSTLQTKIDSNYVPTADITLYARWVYDIVYDANGGIYGDGTTQKNVTYNESKVVSHTPNIDDSGVQDGIYSNYLSITDSVFIPGATRLKIEVWYSTESTTFDWLAIYPGNVEPTSSNYNQASISNGKLGGGYYSNKPTNSSNHVVYYYEGNSINFYFKSDGSSGYYGYYAIVTDASVSYDGEPPSKGAKQSVGWCSDSLCSSGTIDLNFFNNTQSVTTLYAFYPNTITFNPSGGSVSPSTRIIQDGISIGQLPVPVRDDYYFLGWYVEGNDEVLIDETFVPSSDTVLYAKWRDLEYYDITFDKNNNDATGEMSVQTLAENAEGVLLKNQFLRDGYTFMGWNSQSDGSGISYLDEDSILLADDLTLYAQWVKNYTLTFDKNNNDATTVDNNYSISIPSGVPTEIPRYAFYQYELDDKMINNFNTQADFGGGAYYKSQLITITEDTTLYADWSDIEISDTIFWALQDTDNDAGHKNDKLIISSYEVDGALSGSIAGDANFESAAEVPWLMDDVVYHSYRNLSYNCTNIEIKGLVVPKSTAFWFRGASMNVDNLTIDLNKLNTSYVESMNNMFDYTGSGATTINFNFSNLDTHNVTNMSYMFYGFLDSTTSANINLNNFDTSKVTDMSFMFCSFGEAATSIDFNISNWDTSKVTNMNSMFYKFGYNASQLNLNGISNFNTSNVINMGSMFYQTFYSLDSFSLNLSNWNTTKLKKTNLMFYQAGYNSTSFNINISNWNTSHIDDIRGMFLNSGNNASTWNVIIPATNSNGINNTSTHLYGSSSSNYIKAPNNKSYTLNSL